MFIDLPVDLIRMHPIGRPPTREDFLAAEAKPVREWIHEASVSLELTNPDTTVELRAFMMRIGIDLLDTYLHNLAENTWLMKDCISAGVARPSNAVGLWLWYSTEWMLPKDLIQILMNRAMVYHPYAWNKVFCLYYETLEAEFWHKSMKQHDLASLQRHLATATQATPK